MRILRSRRSGGINRGASSCASPAHLQFVSRIGTSPSAVVHRVSPTCPGHPRSLSWTSPPRVPDMSRTSPTRVPLVPTRARLVPASPIPQHIHLYIISTVSAPRSSDRPAPPRPAALSGRRPPRPCLPDGTAPARIVAAHRWRMQGIYKGRLLNSPCILGCSYHSCDIPPQLIALHVITFDNAQSCAEERRRV